MCPCRIAFGKRPQRFVRPPRHTRAELAAFVPAKAAVERAAHATAAASAHSATPRVVLDSSVLIHGVLGTDAASRAVLVAIAEHRLTPLVSAGLLLQYQAAMLDPKLRRAAKRTERQVLRFLASFSGTAELVDTSTPRELPTVDPATDRLLETATRGYAAAVITKRLRALRGRAPRCGVRLLSPAEANDSL